MLAVVARQSHKLYYGGSIPSPATIKNQNAMQGSLPLILRHYKWDSININTQPMKVVRTGYQAFENCYNEKPVFLSKRRED